jgi:hypothetical protein
MGVVQSRELLKYQSNMSHGEDIRIRVHFGLFRERLLVLAVTRREGVLSC